MNEHTKKCEKIIYKLKEKFFPSLRGKKIYISYFSGKKYSGAAFWILPFWRMIFINKKRKFSDNQLIGLFVHELGHFEVYQKRGWLLFWFVELLYWTFPRFREKEEKNVDRKIIQKGYAKEYYSLVKEFYNKKLKSSKYYFSPEEVKSYAQKIRKW